MNAVAKVEQNTAVANTGKAPELQGLVASDVIIPQLYLMQATSDFVADKKASPGQIVRSTTVEAVGEAGKLITFIPLALPIASWIVEARAPKAQRWEFRRREPRHAGNDLLPWLFDADADGNEVVKDSKGHTHEGRRVKCLSVYAILPGDIDAEAAEIEKAQTGGMPDLNKALTPVMISFRSTSFKAGKEVITFFTQADSFKMKAWKYTLKLGAHQESNDDGTFFVFDVDRNGSQPVNPAHLPKVENWANLVASAPSNLKIDETSESSAAPQGQAGSKGLY